MIDHVYEAAVREVEHLRAQLTALQALIQKVAMEMRDGYGVKAKEWADLLTAPARGEARPLDRSELFEKARQITAEYAPGEHGLTNRLVREFETLFAVSYAQGQIARDRGETRQDEGRKEG